MLDMDVIKEIEKELDVVLMHVDCVQFDKKSVASYATDKSGHVCAISLEDLRLTKLDRVILSLSRLSNLTALNLSHNQIEDISQLKALPNLTQLTLRSNKIVEISPLKELVKLTDLDLCSNKIVEIGPLKELPCLTKLDLSFNQIVDISPLKKLTTLLQLVLHSNQMVDIDNLKELINLEALFLGSNQITEIYQLQYLTALKHLYLHFNEITDISPLKKLSNLNVLILHSNEIAEISALKELVNLVELNLNDNKLTDVSPLKELVNLAELNLNKNQIIEINPLKELVNLRRLGLNSNLITDVSPLKGLTNLTHLELSSNRITDLRPLKELKQLSDLDLRGNPFEELHPWITEFNMEIKWLDFKEYYPGYILFNNARLETPPPQIIKQGKQAIKNFFEQIKQQGKDYIYEAKLMIVGEPGSGKTSLMNKMFNPKFQIPNREQKSSVGIDVKPNWSFYLDEKRTFKAHVWDFGGQQIQYMLHQFFLTSDCLYILMAEKRKELANFDYWLNIINVLGKNSPVIILFNEINLDSVSSFIYDEKKYNELFPELSMQKLDINLSNIEDGRYNFLINTIKEKLINLSHIGKEVPARWVDIRRDLEDKKGEKHININDYFAICKRHGINNEDDRMLILKYFHLLGIVLHFSEDTNLSDTIFLDPNWTVDAIYCVLTNKEFENNNGFFELAELYKIWGKKYDYLEKAKLLQLMMKDNFELCYKLPGSDSKYIVPLLLSHIKPEYDWDSNDNLQFRFQYPFMPKGIVSRLIVRMHDRIENNNVWNVGVVFTEDTARAQVIERRTPKEGLKIIEIRLTGNPNRRKELLTLIREEVKKIQNNSFPHLPYSEMVPCNCEECKKGQKTEFYDYKILENFVTKGRNEIQCRNSMEMVKICDLIDAVGIKPVKKEELISDNKRGGFMDGHNINISFSNIGNPQTTVTQQATQTVSQSISIVQDIKNFSGLFKNLKNDILDEVEIEIDDEKEKKRIKNELEKTAKAFEELETKAEKNDKEIDSSLKEHVGRFIDYFSDEDSRFNKALKLVSKGKDRLQSLGRLYNNIAPFFALPSVPPVFLGKKKD